MTSSNETPSTKRGNPEIPRLCQHKSNNLYLCDYPPGHAGPHSALGTKFWDGNGTHIYQYEETTAEVVRLVDSHDDNGPTDAQIEDEEIERQIERDNEIASGEREGPGPLQKAYLEAQRDRRAAESDRRWEANEMPLDPGAGRATHALLEELTKTIPERHHPPLPDDGPTPTQQWLDEDPKAQPPPEGGWYRDRIPENDPTNPEHFKQGDVETIDKIRSILSPRQFSGFCIGNAIKYTDRAPHHRDGLELNNAKARWYMDMLTHTNHGGPDPRDKE